MDKREEILENSEWQLEDSVANQRTVILRTMSEYAQLESIEFAGWIMKNNWMGSMFGWAKYGVDGHQTTSELYQIFKQEQQTTK